MLRFLPIVILLFLGQVKADTPDLDSLKNSAQSETDVQARARALATVGFRYILISPDSAFSYLKKAERFILDNIDTNPKLNVTLGAVYGYLGSAYNSRGQYVQALEFYLKGRRIFRQLQNKRLLAISDNNIGLLYMNLKQFPQARTYFLSAYQESRNQKGINLLSFLSNLGLSYLEAEQYDSARYFTKKAWDLSEEIGAYQGTVLHNLGELDYVNGNYQAAIRNLNAAKMLQLEENRNYDLAETSLLLGKCYEKINEPEPALRELLQAYRVADLKDYTELKARVGAVLAELYESRGETEEAYFYLKTVNDLHESLLGEEKIKEIARLELDYDQEKRAYENQLLRKNKELSDSKLKSSELANRNLIIGLCIAFALLLLSINFFLQKQRANRKLETLNQDLEARVHTRTRELETKNQNLQQFNFNLSHNIRSHVASILGLTHLLDITKEKHPENVEYIEHIKTKTESLDEVLREMNNDLDRD